MRTHAMGNGQSGHVFDLAGNSIGQVVSKTYGKDRGSARSLILYSTGPGMATAAAAIMLAGCRCVVVDTGKGGLRGKSRA